MESRDRLPRLVFPEDLKNVLVVCTTTDSAFRSKVLELGMKGCPLCSELGMKGFPLCGKRQLVVIIFQHIIKNARFRKHI